jgi:hypothetical protein
MFPAAQQAVHAPKPTRAVVVVLLLVVVIVIIVVVVVLEGGVKLQGVLSIVAGIGHTYPFLVPYQLHFLDDSEQLLIPKWDKSA